MSSEVEVLPGINKTEAGETVIVTPIDELAGVATGLVAEHEADHAAAAALEGVEIIEASKVPDATSLGRVILGRFSARAFMAPHARNRAGTGHDVAVVASMGYDPSSVAADARNLLEGHDEEIHAVAALIELKGTISGFEVLEVMDKVRKPDVNIEVISPSGRRWNFVEKTRKVGRHFIPLTITIPTNEKESDLEKEEVESKVISISRHPLRDKISRNYPKAA